MPEPEAPEPDPEAPYPDPCDAFYLALRKALADPDPDTEDT